MTVSHRRIEAPVDRVVVTEPPDRARGRHDEEGREGATRPGVPQRAAGEDQAERRRQHREARMEPREQRRQHPRARPPQRPSRCPAVQARHQAERQHDDDGAGAVGIDREREQQDRCRQRRRRPPEPGCRGAARQQVRRPPGHGRGGRRREGEQERDQAIPAQRNDRRDDRRHARQVDRVDLAVGPAFEIVRPQRTAEVLEVVAPLMVVLDAKVAVAPEALGDDEIVRFVTARHERRQAPGGGVVDHRGADKRHPRRAGRVHQQASQPSARARRRRACRQDGGGNGRPARTTRTARPRATAPEAAGPAATAGTGRR